MLSLWAVHLHRNITDKERNRLWKIVEINKNYDVEKMIEIVIKFWR